MSARHRDGREPPIPWANRLLLVCKRRQLDERNAQLLARLALEEGQSMNGGREAPGTTVGDDKMRGVPILAHGVQGTMAYTQPEMVAVFIDEERLALKRRLGTAA